MKKLRILLSVAAIVFAVGATFAMRSDVLIQGFEYVPGGNPQCISREVNCKTSGDDECMLGANEVRTIQTSTCGQPLWKP